MKFITGNKNNEEKIVKLSLKEDDDDVILTTTDDDGKVWYLMRFINGGFVKFEDVPEGIGIEVNGAGKIVELEINN